MNNGRVKHSGYKSATNKAIKGLKNNRKRKRAIVRSSIRQDKSILAKAEKLKEFAQKPSFQ